MNPSLPNSPLASLMMSLGGSVDFNSLEVSQDGTSGLTDFSDLLSGMKFTALPVDGETSPLAATTEGEGLPQVLPPLPVPVSVTTEASDDTSDEIVSPISLAVPADSESTVSDNEMTEHLIVQIKSGSDISVKYADQSEVQAARPLSGFESIRDQGNAALPEDGRQAVANEQVIAGTGTKAIRDNDDTTSPVVKVSRANIASSTSESGTVNTVSNSDAYVSLEATTRSSVNINTAPPVAPTKSDVTSTLGASGVLSNTSPVTSSSKPVPMRQTNLDRVLRSSPDIVRDDPTTDSDNGPDVFRPVTATDTELDGLGSTEVGRDTPKSPTFNAQSQQPSTLSTPVNGATAAPQTASYNHSSTVGVLTDTGVEGSLPEDASEAFSYEENFEQTMQRQSRDRLDFGQDKREWTPALGARLMTMVANDVQQARIQLDPPELGSLEIKMQIQQDQASVQVSAQSHQIKDVLDAGAQRLRDALASEGIELSEFSVSADAEQGASGSKSESEDGSGQGLADAESSETDDPEGLSVSHRAAPDALLDTFA